MTAIATILGREILDSRGNRPSRSTSVLRTANTAAPGCPQASTGAHEAHELRDGGTRYGGKGVKKAVEAVNGEIRNALSGFDAANQRGLDQLLRDLDGTENKERLGATPSSACRWPRPRPKPMHGRAAHRYIGGRRRTLLPVPMMNIINGGVHADNPIDFQEFMIVPVGASSIAEAVRMGAEVFHALKHALKGAGHSTSVGDEGRFAPNLRLDARGARFHHGGDRGRGFMPGKDVYLALDVAATELFGEGRYFLKGEKRSLTSEADDCLLCRAGRKLSDLLIEDGMSEDDWDGWRVLTERLGKSVQLVGDDLFVTNVARLKQGIDQKIANASWSRSIRSARSARRSMRCEWRKARAMPR